jgi:mRNA interferase MazF
LRRGEIFLVNFDPAEGSEVKKERPAIIVSNDGANSSAERSGKGVITVIPVTSNIAQIYPFQVLLPANQSGLTRDSKVQAEQVRAIAVARLGLRLGEVSHSLMEEVDEALRLHLAL